MRIVLLLTVMTLHSSLAAAQSFEVLGASRATSVSADGSVVVGFSFVEGASVPFRWENGEIVQLPVFPGRFGSRGEARGISADGRIIVGYSSDDSQSDLIFVRWIDGEIERLSVSVATDGGTASAVSADGSVIVGSALRYLEGFEEDREAFRWEDGSSQGLGYLPGNAYSGAADVSADGAVVVGSSSEFINENSRPYRWTGTMEALPLPPGAFQGFANGVSADGTVVVGQAGDTGNYRAVRWTTERVIALPNLAETVFSRANAASADGSVVVGEALVGAQRTRRAWIWTEADGTRDLLSVLTSSGLNLDGWMLERANDISDDGTVIVGEGIDPSGNREAFRIDLAATWAPAEDEIVPPGEPYEVEFVAPDGAETIDLYLVANSQSSGGARTRIAEGLSAAAGTFEWEVDEDLLSPSTFLIAVDASNPSQEVVSPRFRVRYPWLLYRVRGTVAEPLYEGFALENNGWAFDQHADNMWPTSYWDRLENGYENTLFGYDPFIPTIGEVRYDPEFFFDRNEQAHPTWSALVRAFGFEGVYASTEPWDLSNTTIHRVNPSAASRWRSISSVDGSFVTGDQSGYSGVCYGLALGALAAFGDPGAFAARWLPGTSTTYIADIPLSDQVRDAAHALYTYQFGRDAVRRLANDSVQVPDSDTTRITPRAVLARLKARFESDDRALDRALGFYFRYVDESGQVRDGGHAVTPYYLEDLGDGFYLIEIMDPNYTPDVAYIQVDSTSNAWLHYGPDRQPSPWTTRAGRDLYFTELARNALGPADPDWPVVYEGAAPRDPQSGARGGPPALAQQRRDGGPLLVRVAGGDSGVSGDAGTLSYRDGVLTEELPGGRALLPMTGLPGRPWAYALPSGTYTVDLAPTSAGAAALDVGGRLALRFERTEAPPEALADMLRLDTEGGDRLALTPGTAGRVRLSVRATVETLAGEVVRTFAADRLDVTAGLEATVEATPDSSGFRVASAGATRYHLILGTVGAEERRLFYHADVPLAAGATHTVRPDWISLGEGDVTVEVDLDGDGDTDQTITLENEGFPVANEDDAAQLPEAFALGAYPNPTAGTATVELALPEAADVRAEVFDLLGRRVAMLHDGLLAAGTHPLPLDAARLPAGLYVVRAVTPTATLTQRLTVVR